MGFEQHPAVPIDGQVMVRLAWPAFHASAPRGLQPAYWRANGYGLPADNRYMTAIRMWVEQRQWTTADIETTIYDRFT